MTPRIVFDVNETLLDLRALDPPFERPSGERGSGVSGFAQFLQSAFFRPSLIDGAIGRAALEMVAARNGIELTTEARDEILATVRHLPPYPEVLRSPRAAA